MLPPRLLLPLASLSLLLLLSLLPPSSPLSLTYRLLSVPLPPLSPTSPPPSTDSSGTPLDRAAREALDAIAFLHFSPPPPSSKRRGSRTSPPPSPYSPSPPLPTFTSTLVRRSLDSRSSTVRKTGPRWMGVVDVTVEEGEVRERWGGVMGRVEGKVDLVGGASVPTPPPSPSLSPPPPPSPSPQKKSITIVGAGPCGLFASLLLSSIPSITVLLLDRGQPVESRGASIGRLTHRRLLDSESNYVYGEGGAGTWSDGKLTTRIGRNSGVVRHVLKTLVEMGAPERILVDGAPHLGTDNVSCFLFFASPFPPSFFSLFNLPLPLFRSPPLVSS